MTSQTVIDTILAAATDPFLRYAASSLYAEAIRVALADDHRREPALSLSASDVGRCSREVWADLHDAFDLPRDPDVQLARLDAGTMNGAWFAALLKAGLPPPDEVSIEGTCERNGIPGHYDAFTRGTLVEFKTSFSWKPVLVPPWYHLLQAAQYALAVGARTAAIVTFQPMLRGVTKFSGFDFDPAEYADAVDAEYARLSAGVLPTMPAPDVRADEKFRCQSCRFTRCALNKNERQPIAFEADERASLLVALTTSLEAAHGP